MRLAAPERALLRRLSIFAGGWTPEAAAVVCGGEWRAAIADCGSRFTVWARSDNPQSAIRDPQSQDPHSPLAPSRIPHMVERLAGRSLVEGADGRWHLREPVRQTAAEMLAASGERFEAGRRHAGYFLELAETTAPALREAGAATWLNRLEREHDNFRAAMRWFLAGEAGEPGSRGAEETALAGPSGLLLPCSPAPRLSEAALRLTCALWRFWQVRGFLAEGRQWLQAALEAVSPGAPLAVFHGPLSAVCFLRAEAMRGAGTLAQAQGDLPAAQLFHEASLKLWRHLGDQRGEAEVCGGLGWLAMVQRDYPRARALHERSLAIADRLEEPLAQAGALASLAAVAREAGDYRRALSYYRRALALRQSLGDRLGLAGVLNGLGAVALAQGKYAAAEGVFRQALEVCEEIGHRTDCASSLHCLGLVAERRGDLERAQQVQERYLDLARALGNRAAMAQGLADLGRLARRRGDFDLAGALSLRSLEHCRAFPPEAVLAEALAEIAALAGTQGAPDGAARLLGAAAAFRARLGVRLPAHERAEAEQQRSALQSALGDVRFAEAWAEGGRMSADEAIGLARGLLHCCQAAG
jgi:tetratricopeptide (TPR) repeat protein